MRSLLRLLVLVGFVLYGGVVLQAQEDNIRPGELLVRVHPHVNMEHFIAEINGQLPGAQFKTFWNICKITHIWQINFDHTTVSAEQAMAVVGIHPSVGVAQFNHNNLDMRSKPDDPLYDDQWAFFNDGTNGVPAAGLADISAEAAWDIVTGGYTLRGDRIVIAVIDGGFDLAHVDLKFYVNTLEIPGNLTDDDGNGYVDDVSGWDAYGTDGTLPIDNHGTHIAGTIGAKGNNGIGVVGVNWDIDVLPVAGSSSNEATVVAAYSYVHGLRLLYNQSEGDSGAYVVATNSSFGVNMGDPVAYPLWCGYYDDLGTAGILNCGATANVNWNIDVENDIPTACPSDYLISVTNVDSEDDRAFAGYGITTIDLGAPGTGIKSTYPSNNYQTVGGTSMATPHVTGAIGLMYAAACKTMITSSFTNPDTVALFVRNKLLNEGVDVVPDLVGEVVTGGRINLEKAVKSMQNYNITLAAVGSTCGNADGAALVSSVTGNQGFIEYLWDDSTGNQTTDTAFNVGRGYYSVTVTDTLCGFTRLDSVEVIDIDAPLLDLDSVPVSCFGGNDGMAIVVATGGGIPTYTYGWNDGLSQSNDTAISLTAGVYEVIVTDGTGCTIDGRVVVTQPSAALFLGYSTVGNSATPPNGSINLTPTGGTPPYTILWDNGSPSEDQFNLFQGDYTVTVTDAKGCVENQTVTVTGDVGVTHSISQRSIDIFPNPNNGKFTIDLRDVEVGSYTIGVRNMVGQIVLSVPMHVNENSAREPISLGGVAEGVYFVEVRDQQKTLKTIRMIVRR